MTIDREKAAKLNPLIEAVFGSRGPTHPNALRACNALRALVQEITDIDLCPPPPEVTYKIGDRFKRRSKQDDYIIAVVENGSYSTQKQVIAINLRTGARLGTKPTAVCSLYQITRAELCTVMGVPPNYVRHFDNWVQKIQESGITAVAQPSC